jgi:surface antigen
MELVAVTPPVDGMTAEARCSVQTAFQRALEEKRSGVPQSWHLAELDLAGSVTPMATFRLKSGTYCRQYIQQLNQASEEKVFYGLACRTPTGEWQIPGR